MRLLLAAGAIVALFAWSVRELFAALNTPWCELVGHDAHWPTSSLRACKRCPQTWDRQHLFGDMAATTSNQPQGW